MNKAIGGYFELEPTGGGGSFPQYDGVLLNTARNSLELILNTINDLSKIYIPFYTCDVMLEPIIKKGLQFEFYHINPNLEIEREISLSQGEYIIYTNYFGIKDAYARQLVQKYGDALIIDCAQALYFPHNLGINVIYSPRKFVGIPDGGVAYTNRAVDISEFDIDDSTDRMSHLFLRKEKGAKAGYAEFKANSKKLVMQPIKLMSPTTKASINLINFEEIKEKRKENFCYLHSKLALINHLGIPPMNSFECPMVYPFWTDDETLKSKLISKDIFVATYWPSVLEWTSPDMLEHTFAKCLLALPCDQRYDQEDMDKIIKLIKDR